MATWPGDRTNGDQRAVAAGVTPWVNLFHFTHPRWFAARGGFLEAANHAAFLRYVEVVGRALAPHARHFHVSNESMVYVLTGYMMGAVPPFVKTVGKTSGHFGRRYWSYGNLPRRRLVEEPESISTKNLAVISGISADKIARPNVGAATPARSPRERRAGSTR